MTTLYLTRHGETVDNVNKIMQGQTQGQLSDNGRRQALGLSAHLTDVHFDAIVSSDLRRAVQTAQAVADSRGMTVTETPLLRERDWGGFTGRYIPSLKDEPWPDDIESAEDLLARAGEFLTWVKANYKDKQILAVGHGIIDKAIQSVYYGKLMREILPMSNCEVRVLSL